MAQPLTHILLGSAQYSIDIFFKEYKDKNIYKLRKISLRENLDVKSMAKWCITKCFFNP